MDNETAQLMTVITNIVGQHGCSIAHVDLENHVIQLEGAEEDKEACAMALAEILD